MYFLGYDLGTSSVKACIVESDTGAIVASDFFPKEEAQIKALKPGWAEQSPDTWWNFLKAVTASVLSKSRVDAADIKAIGLSYQMHGLVCLDKSGKPIRDAIIWCDSRGVPYGEKAFNELGSEVCLSHLLNSPGNFTAAKLAWVKENEPENFEKIWKVMLPADYVAYRLTGNIITNPEGLSEYMLWDFKTGSIAQFLLDYYGFPAEIFPDVQPTFSDQGKITQEAARELGLSPNTMVTYRGGDQPNNALSLGVLNPGEIASTAGTSGVVYGINDCYDYDPKSRINNFAHVNHTATDPRIGVMVCINGTGILNSWVKHNVAPADMSYNAMNETAATVAVGSDGLSILPFGNGAERVLQNRQIGCQICDINFNLHKRPHIYRAAQEGIAFSFNYGIEIMNTIGMKVNTIHAGNANMFLSPVFRDTIASVTGATVQLFDTDGAAGAAKGAAIGYGLYKDPAEAFSNLRRLAEIEPATDRTPYLEAYARWKECLKRFM